MSHQTGQKKQVGYQKYLSAQGLKSEIRSDKSLYQSVLAPFPW